MSHVLFVQRFFTRRAGKRLLQYWHHCYTMTKMSFAVNSHKKLFNSSWKVFTYIDCVAQCWNVH